MALIALALPASAMAQATASRIDDAVTALESDSVYVDPDAERALADSEAQRLRDAIRREKAGPMYIAVLPDAAANEAGGDPGAALREIALAVDEPGTYAALAGDSFRAGSMGGVLEEGEASKLATEAYEAKRGDGSTAVLEDFVRRVGKARADGGGGDSSGGGGFPGFLLALLAIPAVLFGLSRRRRRKQEQADLEQVRHVARDDVVALGDDIRALDLDMEMPDADPEAKEHYAMAVDRYTQASEALDRARRPEDVRAVTELLEEGRWAMEAARAESEGRTAPERRPPCFFDPRHGPSVKDVEWAPADGVSRSVPVCAADAAKIDDGQDPEMRHISVDGERVPYWQAGPAFGPWAGGFFGGGLVPGLFIGSMLGGGFGGFGGFGADEARAGEGDQGDFGDFGSGDFGSGGDFGGGGGFGGGGDF